MSTVNLLQVNQFTEILNFNLLCRLCATDSDKLIGIFSDEGIVNDLAEKINLYLPIKVTESDSLPLQCCWQCASTLLAWHELVITTAESDQKLKSCSIVNHLNVEVIRGSFDEEASFEATRIEDPLVTTSIDAKKIHPDLNADQTTEPLDQSVKEEFTANYLDLLEPNESTDVQLKRSISAISLNLSNAEEKPVKLECLECSLVFATAPDMLDHMQQDHPVEPTKKSKRKSSLRSKHIIKHPPLKINHEEVDKVKVEIDGKTFFVCKQCGKSLHSVYTYVWHMRIHTGERPYVCHLCKKQFRVSHGLVRHLKETHDRIKDFDCDICGRSFATKRNVTEHRRIHTNERPYVCALCGKAFKQKASLFVHNRSHSTEYPFSCKDCSQKFRTKPALLVHATRHTGEKPFPCDVCGRHFRIKYELKRHKLVHSQDKPFNCMLCRQSFRQKRYLRNHLKLNHSITNPNIYLDEYVNGT